MIWRDEIEAWRKDGLLTRLDLAFSRDQAEKIYVQHRLSENAADVWTWLEEGAHVYVCGDAKAMARDVNAALTSTIAEQGGMDAQAAKTYTLDTSAVAATAVLSLSMVPIVGFGAGAVTFLIAVFLGELAYIAASRRRPLSDRGKRLYWELVGYREYLRAAESGRIRWNESSGNPSDEHVPYAIVFGISTAWATKLQSVTSAFLESFPL